MDSQARRVVGRATLWQGPGAGFDLPAVPLRSRNGSGSGLAARPAGGTGARDRKLGRARRVAGRRRVSGFSLRQDATAVMRLSAEATRGKAASIRLKVANACP